MCWVDGSLKTTTLVSLGLLVLTTYSLSYPHHTHPHIFHYWASGSVVLNLYFTPPHIPFLFSLSSSPLDSTRLNLVFPAYQSQPATIHRLSASFFDLIPIVLSIFSSRSRFSSPLHLSRRSESHSSAQLPLRFDSVIHTHPVLYLIPTHLPFLTSSYSYNTTSTQHPHARSGFLHNVACLFRFFFLFTRFTHTLFFYYFKICIYLVLIAFLITFFSPVL